MPITKTYRILAEFEVEYDKTWIEVVEGQEVLAHAPLPSADLMEAVGARMKAALQQDAGAVVKRTLVQIGAHDDANFDRPVNVSRDETA